MKRFASLHVLASLFCISLPPQAQAQQQLIPFNELKATPKDVVSVLPRGTKSLHFGTLKIGPKNSDVLIHIYNFGLRKKLGTVAGDRVGRLELLRRVNIKGRTRLTRLNTVKLDSYDDVDPVNGTVTGQWLDTKTQRIPVLRVQASGGGGFGGGHSVFVFAHGLSKPPVFQRFDYSYNPGQDGNSFTFDLLDERSFIVVNPINSTFGLPYPDNVLDAGSLYWNGTQFARRPIPTQPQPN